jgi:hypothetical protein
VLVSWRFPLLSPDLKVSDMNEMPMKKKQPFRKKSTYVITNDLGVTAPFS